MDPLTQVLNMRIRAGVKYVERRLPKAKERNARVDQDSVRNAVIIKAYLLGQQFKDARVQPFEGWNHPLAKELQKSFAQGQGGGHVPTA